MDDILNSAREAWIEKLRDCLDDECDFRDRAIEVRNGREDSASFIEGFVAGFNEAERFSA